MDDRFNRAKGVVFVLGTLLFAAPMTVIANELTLKEAVTEVLASNPGLAAIQARAQGLAAIPSQVRTRPDPQLSVNMLNLPVDSFAVGQVAMTQFQLGLSQMLPYPGKLALRETAAIQNADAAQQDVQEQQLKLVRDVKILWWNLHYLDRALEVVGRNQKLLRQSNKIAETRYQLGQGLQQDVLLAQLELSKLQATIIHLQGLRDSEVIRINVLLARPAEQLIQLPAARDEELFALPPTDELLRRSVEIRPLLKAQQHRLAAATARLDLARKNYMPDFKLKAAYGLRSGVNPNGSQRADFASLMLSMNLPLYSASKQDKAVDQHNAARQGQKYKLADKRNQVAAEVSRAIADYRSAAEQASLFKQGIIPQAALTVESMRVAYQVGKVDFLNLVRAQITLYNYETKYWKVISQGNQALARLVAATAKEINHEQ